MKILIGTPVYNLQVTSPFVESLLGLTDRFHAEGIAYQWLAPSSAIITVSRNVLASYLLEGDYTHLLFIDADIAFRVETVMRLIAQKRPVVAAAYPHRRFNLAELHAEAQRTDSPTEAFARSLTYPVEVVRPLQIDRGCVRVSAAPAGLMLIERAVFERLRDTSPEKYIAVADAPHGVKHMMQCFEPVTGEGGLALGEDYSFCRRWTDLGGEIWTLVEDAIGHTGPHTFWGAAASKMGARRR